MAATPQLTNKLNEGIAHHQAGRLDRAEAIYRQVATQAPRLAVVFDLWARLAAQQRRTEDATRLFHQALKLDPRSVPCAVEFASLLIGTCQSAEAEKVLRKLVTDLPRSPDAWNALGFVLKILGRLDEAMACHERAVGLNPKFAEGWTHWGLTLMLPGRNFEALDKFRRALALNPRLPSARYGRAQTLHKIYRIAEALTDYDAVIAAEPQNLEARSYRLFALQTLESISRDQLFAEHVAYGRAVGEGPSRLDGYDLSPDRRLRIAILSPDFRTHSCAYFIEPLLRHLDRTAFEIYLYHDNVTEDSVSARFKTYAAVWRNLVGQSPAAFEMTVRADKPDILIDLTGHIGNTIRLPSFAKRLAPVQVTYLGYPDTTGVQTMDFRFTDPVADPPGDADRYTTEKLVRLGPCAWCFQPAASAPAVAPLPCTQQPGVTFGCFSAPTKFTDTLMAAWGRILTAVPTSRLLLKGQDFEHAEVRDWMMKRLEKAGVGRDRVELLPRTADTVSHLALYGLIDIALDTFPYVGTTTTCEALWMGRPVVTLVGNRHAARVGASLLSTVGHPEWIGTSVDDYVRIAIELSKDTSTLQRTSAELRSQMSQSALMDHEGQAKRFGEALRRCWRERASLPA